MSRAARATIELPAQKSAVKVSKKYGFDQTQPTTRDTNEGMKTNSDPKTPTRFSASIIAYDMGYGGHGAMFIANRTAGSCNSDSANDFALKDHRQAATKQQ